MEHSIIVGNIGTVYAGKDKKKALDYYNSYCNMSISGYGRASEEPVAWFTDGEIYQEFEV